MSTRSRRQTRQLRSTPYRAWPDVHNASVARRKALIRDTRRLEVKRRERARAFRDLSTAARLSAAGIRTLSVAIFEFGVKARALAAEAERQRQIAWADRMSVLGFDMRDEHDALERGELVD